MFKAKIHLKVRDNLCLNLPAKKPYLMGKESVSVTVMASKLGRYQIRQRLNIGKKVPNHKNLLKFIDRKLIRINVVQRR